MEKLKISDLHTKQILIYYTESSRHRKEKSIILHFFINYNETQSDVFCLANNKSCYLEYADILDALNYVNRNYNENRTRFSVLCNILFWKATTLLGIRKSSMYIKRKYELNRIY